ncbi:DUF4258 domain-containing protein [Candidatus Poribacteria bacterium]|nr:DUF4258 domain-containing protein [Candidatus Poribacteria bacterium]
MKSIQLTNHAQKRMQKRQINLHEIQQVLAFPDRTQTLGQGKRKSTKRMKNRDISVIYVETATTYRIITVEFRRVRR